MNGDLYVSSTINPINYDASADADDFKEAKNTKKDICQKKRIKIGLKRIAFVNRVIDVWCDYAGQNVSLIRVSNVALNG